MSSNTFHAMNSGQLIELYDRFRQDPASVDEATRLIFEQWQPSEAISEQSTSGPVHPEFGPLISSPAVEKVIATVNLAQAIRTYGHLEVQLDPLGYFKPPGDASLAMGTYGLTEADLAGLPAGLVGGSIDGHSSNALEAISSLRKVYTKACGYDYSHIHDPAERDWLRDAAEQGRFRPVFSNEASRALLRRLTEVESFELFLHRFFPGKTRFSIEGEELLIPILDELIELAVESGICTIMIGMPHRGRLNVLAHILCKPYEQILEEFKDPAGNTEMMQGRGWTGDVKYHRGARYASPGKEEIRIIMGMPPIPSHLELVDPVVTGMTRALQSNLDQPGKPVLYPDASLPVLIHGDAAFPGEGIVAETLNLSRLVGYEVAGTLHIIVNNQIGYTTLPGQGRSTLYSSDLAKGFEIPIIHVNANDPQACSEAVRTAVAYREQFHKDFLIDLVGYRRYGHNEGDEPAFTQPTLYRLIQKQLSIRQLWADQLVAQGVIEKGEAEKLRQEAMQVLQDIFKRLPSEGEPVVDQIGIKKPKKREIKANWDRRHLLELADFLLKEPPQFNLNSKLARALEKHRQALVSPDQPLVDWSLAEELALASILSDGISIRFTGEDVERGTFSQRHAVFHDTVNENTYIPLQSLPQAKASFDIHNSPLSEAAALAFEYGFSVQDPDGLVIWEAQYGDFVNNAQSILDEFFLSGFVKWQQRSGLVLLLPHGNEGQGPDHSSSHPERFLQMSAGTALRLVNCTTASQYFHLLRDQAIQLPGARLPLVVLSPKSLLRHPLVASSIDDLSKGEWMPVLDDEVASKSIAEIHRLVLCTGKIAIDLLDSDFRRDSSHVAIIRVEQLCPFPGTEIGKVLDRYSQVEEICWVQEEPENMGAWTYLQPQLLQLFQGRWPLHYIGRPASPSSSEGSFTRYTINQKELFDQVFRQDARLNIPSNVSKG
jgi:2-oxoglutarate dehydrogenase E1 component